MVDEEIQATLGVESHIFEDQLIEIVGEGLELATGDGGGLLTAEIVADEAHHVGKGHKLKFVLLGTIDRIELLSELFVLRGVVFHVLHRLTCTIYLMH
jgi:hypothetical protein